ncbi:MAG: rRNA maturation RNase YbeY [Actinomycetes bacterium]
MTIDLFVSDEQDHIVMDLERWSALAQAALREEGVRGAVEVSLIFSDEPTIADLNERFMGKSGPTDVLSFPIDDEPLYSGRFPDSGGTGPGEPIAPMIPSSLATSSSAPVWPSATPSITRSPSMTRSPCW